MQDKDLTIQELKQLVADFIKERDWNKFHDPKNLSMAISAEAAELMELFLWTKSSDVWQELEKNRKEVEHELADIVITTICFANACNIDILQAVKNKLALNEKKYPVEKAFGKATKYTKL